MAFNTLFFGRRDRGDHRKPGGHAEPRRRRQADRDPTILSIFHEPVSEPIFEARLVLYFGAILVCTAVGLGLEQLHMGDAAWCLFISAGAFLVAAVRVLFVDSSTEQHRR